MTDKVQKVREEVERLQNELIQEKEKGYGSDIDDACILELQNVLTYIDSLQEEPVSKEIGDYDHKAVMESLHPELKEEPASKVWHDARFKPYPDSHIVVVLQNGQVSNYTYTDYCHNGEFWLKNDISHLRLKVVKWAYVDELLNY